MRRFELSEGTSNKFWEVDVDGKTLTVTFGRIGTAGQSKSKTLASPSAATKEAEKLVREKVARGYSPAKPGKAPGKKSVTAPGKKASPTRVVPFGYQTAWYAVKGATPESVAKALGGKARAVDWQEGVDAAYAGETFVTPATTTGWVLATSTSLQQELSSLDDVKQALGRLSAEEVQFFATDRTVGLGVWAVARKQKLVRALFELDGERDEEGKPVKGEPPAEDEADSSSVDEDTVMTVAGAWSINPQLVADHAWTSPRGLLLD